MDRILVIPNLGNKARLHKGLDANCVAILFLTVPPCLRGLLPQRHSVTVKRETETQLELITFSAQIFQNIKTYTTGPDPAGIPVIRTITFSPGSDMGCKTVISQPVKKTAYKGYS